MRTSAGTGPSHTRTGRSQRRRIFLHFPRPSGTFWNMSKFLNVHLSGVSSGLYRRFPS